ncbi:1-phosphatidylinositol 4,5-bisphosphate phosphodiesterase classes I and II-like isoform X3 [Centruroides vittatus]|uniref:1-phosphatidylinositol 4,5-bisphosphate phosphodiesterase classes I and II-like isoform X3 n=1 Tax=Centruroides vittatus TaxID=120091 RepID=UPI00350FF67E
MAGGKSTVHVVQLKPIVVPKSLQEGNKFVKWDDESTVGIPVTLKVDKKGFFLYWTDQNKDTECLKISNIRDTRTGKYAKIPRDRKLRDSVTMGAADVPLEDKTVTVVYGSDLVNLFYVNFCCNRREMAEFWTDELLKMAYNLLAMNASAVTFLEKAYTELHLTTDKDFKLPVKNIIKMFAQHKDDKKRVEKALEACNLPTGKNDGISSEKFTFDIFFNFYRHLVGREEVDNIFESLCGGNKKKGMTAEQLVNFLNKEQRDPRLNEILYPYCNLAHGAEIIKQYESKNYAQKGLLSADGFLKYLMSDDNAIVAPEKFDLNQDMDHPLSHYFINSSHNTYLTGHQLTGRSSVEMYRQCLLAGCRCVELDCWNGRNSDEEPIITHGYTVVTEILLKEVLEAIADSAFKTSAYPVILSFENHCSQKQQAKMAMYCSKIFGDMLLTEPLSTHQLKPNQPLPSPNQLIRKIIIKNKRKHYPRASKPVDVDVNKEDQPIQLPQTTERLNSVTSVSSLTSNAEESQIDPGGGGTGDAVVNGIDTTLPGKSSGIGCEVEETDTESGSEDEDLQDRQTEDQNEGTAAKESEAGAEMSALVNYIQPVRFHSFEYAERRNRSYEISSFVETQATNLLKERPIEFVNYNKRQLSRIYPRGTRVDSSNYMPQVFWNAGCQLTALNFQTLDLGMQLNLGIFEYNGCSGYLLKPDFMRRNDRKFDPFTESTVDGIIAGTVTVKVISGQFLSDKRVGTYVEVDMYGLPADTVRRRFRTKTIPANGINPFYDEEPFVFKKVVLPDLACLRFSVYDDGNKFIGHRVLPVVGLRPGYRHISLRNESGQPLTLPTIFVYITVKDYIPDGLSELADALENPIAYQSMVEKHASQLMALTDDDDESSVDPKPRKSIPFDAGGSVDKSRASISREEPIDLGGMAGRHSSMNGGTQRPSVTGNSSPVSPAQKPSDLHGTTRSFSEDIPQEKPASLLDTFDLNVTAETIDQIKEHKLVKKVLAKLDRDLQLLRKKHDKLTDKEKELQQVKEDKLAKLQEQHKTQLVKTHNKLAKKSSSSEMQIIKRKSEAGLLAMSAEHQIKLEGLQRSYNQNVLSLKKELYKAELELQEKYHEPLYSAIEKAMQLSQAAQFEQLQNLHDKVVNDLKKRMENQTKEQMLTLSRKHKDKNELARVKRELHQKLIEQGVSERQKLTDLLNKGKLELEKQHEEVKRSFDEDKIKAYAKLQEDFEQRCLQLTREYEKSPVSTSSESPHSTPL